MCQHLGSTLMSKDRTQYKHRKISLNIRTVAARSHPSISINDDDDDSVQ